MKIAIGGKGGSGKTTVAGTLARALAQAGRKVLAIDGDSNPNLAATIGVAAAPEIKALPQDLLVDATDGEGGRRRVLGKRPEEVVEQYAVAGPDGVRLILGGRVGHAGTGCMCGAHARVRSLLGELIDGDWTGQDVVLDLEAGLENFSRGTPRYVEAILTVVEPYYRSLETGRRVCELARELGVAHTRAVANRIRSRSELAAVQEFCDRHEMRLMGEIPYDETLLAAERAGHPPIDHDPQAPAVSAIRQVAAALTENRLFSAPRAPA